MFTKIISLSNETNVGFLHVLNQTRAMDSIKQEVMENSRRGMVYFITLQRKKKTPKGQYNDIPFFFKLT